jgi:hypothetical protein
LNNLVRIAKLRRLRLAGKFLGWKNKRSAQRI